MSKESGASSGIGFGGLLAAIFITLKLIGKIDWSWWWVLAPIWMPITIVLVISGVAAFVVARLK